MCSSDLAGADAGGGGEVEDEHLAVADRLGAGDLLDRLDDPRGEFVAGGGGFGPSAGVGDADALGIAA